MSYTINGTCSLCGGAVTTPTFWWGVIPPTPTCSQCGAIPLEPHGPVIPMRPVQTGVTTTVRTVQTIQELQDLIDRLNADKRPRLSTTPADDVQPCVTISSIAPQRGMSMVTTTTEVKVWPALAHVIANRGAQA